MAIAYDDITTAEDTAETEIDVAHTPVGTPALIIGILACTDVNVSSVTTATYGGQNMTLIGSKITFTDWDGTRDLQVWFYKHEAPLSGNRTMSFVVDNTSDVLFAAAISFTGSKPSGATGTLASATGSNSSPTVNVTSPSGELVVGICITHDGIASITAGGGQTQRFEDLNVGPGAGGMAIEISTEPGSGTTTHSYSLGSSENWMTAGVSLLPPAVIPQIAHHRRMMGGH